MFLKDTQSNGLVKISEIDDLTDPNKDSVKGQLQSGQEEQSPNSFAKKDLIFPSGEKLPRCWVDASYRMESEPS